jgi:O-antigen/teichoic acid export membrane protein
LAAGDPRAARDEVVSAFRIGLAVAFVGAAVFVSPAGTGGLSIAFPGTAVASVSVLVGLRIVVRVIELMIPEAIRAFRDVPHATIFDGLLSNSFFVAVLGIAWIGGAAFELRDLMLIWWAAAVFALLPALVVVGARVRAIPGPRSRARNPVEVTVWLSMIGQVAIAQLDLLVIGVLAGSAEIALYAAAFRLARLAALPLLVVNKVIAPFIAGWYGQGDRRRVESTTRETAAIAVGAAALLATGCLVAGHVILRILFGSGYEGAYTVLVILVMGEVVQTATGSCGTALVMTGHHRQYSILLWSSVGATLLLDVIFYALMGAMGVAVATAAMLSIQNIAQATLVKRLAGFSTTADLHGVGQRLRVGRRAPKTAAAR